MLQTAGDGGFLRIDPQRGLFLFEGDRERYRIPAGAVFSCEVEQVGPHNSFMTQTDHYPHFVAFRGNHSDGPWEAPLAVRHDERGICTGSSHPGAAGMDPRYHAAKRRCGGFIGVRLAASQQVLAGDRNCRGVTLTRRLR